MVGQTLGSYRILQKLGEGGMGVVYLAEHSLIGRRVAVKLLHRQFSLDPDSAQRFLNEARAVNAIRHPHIVDITDVGTTATGEYYLAMELLEGESLADRLHRGPLTPDAAARIAVQMAAALAAAHAKGIIHRDLKPDNVFLVNQEGNPTYVKLLDFGIAKLTGQGPAANVKTQTGAVIGTPQYMSPEQCEGSRSLDQRTDIYSLGVMLFEMLTGKPPFLGEGFGQIFVKHMQEVPPTFRSLGVDLPSSMEAVVMRALAKKPEERFESMKAFREAVIAAYAGDDVETARRLTTMSPLSSSPPKARPKAGLTIGAMALALVDRIRHHEPVRKPTTQVAGERPSPKHVQHHYMGFALGGLAVVAGAALVILLLRPDKPATRAEQAPVQVSVNQYAPAPAPPPKPEPVAAVEKPPEPPPPRKVKLALLSEPTGAEVRLVGSVALVGTTPTDWELTAADQEVKFVFSKAGFQPLEKAVVPSVNQDVLAQLAPVAPAKPARPVRAVRRKPQPTKTTLEDPFDE